MGRHGGRSNREGFHDCGPGAENRWVHRSFTEKTLPLAKGSLAGGGDMTEASSLSHCQCEAYSDGGSIRQSGPLVHRAPRTDSPSTLVPRTSVIRRHGRGGRTAFGRPRKVVIHPYRAREKSWRREGGESGVDESRLNGGDGRANPAGKQCRHGQAKVNSGRVDSVFGPVHGGNPGCRRLTCGVFGRVRYWAMLKRGVGRSVGSRSSRKGVGDWMRGGTREGRG